MSTLTENTSYVLGTDSDEIGASAPTGNIGFQKNGSQTGFFIHSKQPYTLWLKTAGVWSQHQAFSSSDLQESTTYAWGSSTAAYVQTSESTHQVFVYPRTGSLLVDGDPSDSSTNADTLVQGPVTTPLNVTTPQAIPSSGAFEWNGQATGLAIQSGEFSWSSDAIYEDITSLTFHKVDEGGTDQSLFLDQYLNAKSGQIKVRLDAHPGHHNVFQIVGASIDANGHYKFDVYCAEMKDEPAVTSGSCAVHFVLVGAEGAQGPAGPAGADGAEGPQGPAGANGTSGDMGGTMTSHIIPDTNAAYDLGNAEYKIRHLFLSDNSMYIGDTWIKAEGDSVKMENLLVGDLNLNNTGRQNEVDGTSGHWSIQEGAEDLFLINRTTGKKYRFNITEVEEN